MADYTLTCTECGASFEGSPSQVSRFRRSNCTKKVLCSVECINRNRSKAAAQMHRDGRLTWGSPAQIAQAKRLGATAPRGEAAYNWKGGKYSAASKAAARARGVELRARVASMKAPCQRCGVTFQLNSLQRAKWNKRGAEASYFCPECSANPTFHFYKAKQLRKQAEEIAYYADACCSGCGVTFSPNVSQRAYRRSKPEAALYCNDTCRKEHMPDGPDSPGWKHGLFSNVVKETILIMAKINRQIKEGASQ